MTSHQQFKSIGEVFSMTFLHGKIFISVHELPVKQSPSGEPCLTIWKLRVSMYRKRTPFDPSEIYDEAAAREWNWKSEFSDWSSNLIGSNLIRRSIWLLNYFWKLFLNQNFSFLHIQIKFIVREFYCSMSRSKVFGGQRRKRSPEVILRNFGIVKKMVLQRVWGF